LHAWGARVTTHIYPGLGHQVDARELRDMKEFLSALETR
jgi:predicted esterase